MSDATIAKQCVTQRRVPVRTFDWFITLGVMGLRRGFIQAGAQNLLMTLWPISDETTVQIMLDFYDAALKSGSAPQAPAETERDWLVKLRKERGLLDLFGSLDHLS